MNSAIVCEHYYYKQIKLWPAGHGRFALIC